MQEKIEQARELVRQGEARLRAAKDRVEDAIYDDAPGGVDRIARARLEADRARAALALYRAQLSELERNAAQGAA